MLKLLAFLALAATACGRSAHPGPAAEAPLTDAGLQGPQGPAGPTGPAGPAGASGLTIKHLWDYNVADTDSPPVLSQPNLAGIDLADLRSVQVAEFSDGSAFVEVIGQLQGTTLGSAPTQPFTHAFMVQAAPGNVAIQPVGTVQEGDTTTFRLTVRYRVTTQAGKAPVFEAAEGAATVYGTYAAFPLR